MSNQNKGMDKVNMSLDDIIKLNRNQSRQNKFSANRNINVNNKPQQQQQKNGQRRNFNNGNNQNRRPNQQRRQQQQQQQQKAPVNNKPYGMLNRSKTIQKRNTFQQNKQKVVILQTNRNQQQSASRGIPRNLNNRRRLANAGAPRLFNRFGSKAATIGTKFQGQKQNFARNNQQPRQPQRNRAQPFRQQQPVKNVKIQMQQKRIQQLRQPRAANNVRQKIAMQSARKNVMKAKRVLANKVTAKKGPIQQIMTQRYAKSLGLIKPVGVRRPMTAKRALPRQSNKLSTLNVKNRINKTTRVKQQQRKNLTKNVQQQFKRPALNRNRQQQGQSIPGRKVFF